MKKIKQNVQNAGMSGNAGLKLDWVSHKAAKFACQNWHYSKTIPANKSNYIGVWENDIFIGVIIFGLGASPSLGTRYGLSMFQCCELTRVALNNHITPVSRIISISISMIKQKNPKLSLIVSFADKFHNHTGKIYQAGNWIFSGETSKGKILSDKEGNLIDIRRFNGHGHNIKKSIPIGLTLISTPGKYRYLYPLNKDIRERISILNKPYPKCVSSIKSSI
jgi:hypothetical protein